MCRKNVCCYSSGRTIRRRRPVTITAAVVTHHVNHVERRSRFLRGTSDTCEGARCLQVPTKGSRLSRVVRQSFELLENCWRTNENCNLIIIAWLPSISGVGII